MKNWLCVFLCCLKNENNLHILKWFWCDWWVGKDLFLTLLGELTIDEFEYTSIISLNGVYWAGQQRTLPRNRDISITWGWDGGAAHSLFRRKNVDDSWPKYILVTSSPNDSHINIIIIVVVIVICRHIIYQLIAKECRLHNPDSHSALQQHHHLVLPLPRLDIVNFRNVYLFIRSHVPSPIAAAATTQSLRVHRSLYAELDQFNPTDSMKWTNKIDININEFNL